MDRVQINGKRYYVRGQYPNYDIGVSVTEFLGKVFPTSQHLKDWWIDNSREFVENTLRRTSQYGTHFHQIAEDLAQGHDIDISKMEPKLQHHVTSLAHFFHDRNVEPICVERRVFHEATEEVPLSFGGTLDLECMMDWNGGRVRGLLDYKSGNIYKKHKFQLIAYMCARLQTDPELEFHLFNFSPNNWRRKPTGKPKHWTITKKDLESFISLATLYANEFGRLPSSVRQFKGVSLGNEPQYEEQDLNDYIQLQLNQ